MRYFGCLACFCVALMLWVLPAHSAEPLSTPVLVIEPGAHSAAIVDLTTDATGTRAATASIDGTVRLWRTDDGTLERTIRLPRGSGHIGKAFSVALHPDGSLLAVGGWTRWSDADPQEQVYIFATDDGRLIARLDGLPNVTHHLAFAPDGARLVAGLGGQSGIVFWQHTDGGWQELQREKTSTARVAALAFSNDGRLAVASVDGNLRLFDADGAMTVQRQFESTTPSGLDFSPDGMQLAMSFTGDDRIHLIEADRLTDVAQRQDQEDAKGDLGVVEWSDNGLFTGGSRRMSEDVADILIWQNEAVGQRFPIARNTVTGIAMLEGGDLLVAAADPMLTRVAANGATVWTRNAQKMDFRDQHDTLAVSDDGLIVDFAPAAGEERVRFDIARLTLEEIDDSGLTKAPYRSGISLTAWNDSRSPLLNGQPLQGDPSETFRAAAISPRDDRIFLGSDWNLRAYRFDGEPVWARPVPSAAWAVNATANGQLVVAGYGDGSIRWHRADDGTEILALFVVPGSRDWVVWTPEGIYAATPGARSVLRWHVNRGWDAAAEMIPVHTVPNTRRPNVIPHVLPQQGTAGALAVAELAEIRNSVQLVTGAAAAPGAVLHVLSIGVGDYNDAHAGHLDLSYADKDADDIARALVSSQKGLYSKVNLMRLVNQEATTEGILRGLATLREVMSRGDGTDLAVVYFSGHGALINEDFYFLPHDVDTRDPIRIVSTAINAVQVQREIAQMARFGRVLVLLDACRSGAATAGGQNLEINGDRLRSLMQGPNISVLNSSTAEQDSLENTAWENGAFTEVMLEAIKGHAADLDANGILTVTEMTGYLSKRLPELTEGRQTPSVEVRFESAVFAVGP